MSFSNPIVAGGNLQVPSIKSPNYVAGSSGWIIERNGDAEFNDLTIRGTFNGTDFVIDSNGIFFYAGTPAAGNLLISIANTAGSDSFGNSYPQGYALMAGGKTLVMSLTGGSPIVYFGTGNPGIHNSTGLQGISLGAGSAEYDQFQILGAQNTTFTDTLDTLWESSSTDGTRFPQSQDVYTDTSGGLHTYRTVSYNGEAITGAVTAVQPGTGTGRATPAAPETWHTVTPTAIWTTTGTTVPARYRFQPDGTVRLDGELITTGAGPWPANVTIFSLPSGYMPPNNHSFVTRSDIAVAAGQATVNVLSSGGVQNGQAFTASGQRLFFDNVTFPMS